MDDSGGPRTLIALIGHNVRILRAEKRWTQKNLSDAVAEIGGRLRQSRVAQIEAGTAPGFGFAQVLQLAFAFNVPVSRLVSGTGAVDVAGSECSVEWIASLLGDHVPFPGVAGPGMHGAARMRWYARQPGERAGGVNVTGAQIRSGMRLGIAPQLVPSDDHPEAVVSLSRARRGEPRRRAPGG